MKKLLTLLIIFMSIFTTKVYAASNIDILDATVIEKSSTITVEDPILENNTISSKVKFNQINDYVIYEFTLKNNDSYDYKVDEVVDNNTNSNLLIEYDYSEKLLSSGNGTLRIKLTYKNKLLNVDKITLDNLEIKMNLTKSDGSKSQVSITSPKTGDNIVKYLLLLIISVVGIVLTKKNIKFKKIKVGNMLLIVSILLIPFTIFAAEKFEIKIKFSDVEVKGEFEVYEIEAGDTTKEITYGQKLGELPEPEKTGYTFVKWEDEDGNTVTSDTVITKPLTLTPKYQINEYTITYNLDDGEATNETKYTVEDEFTLNNPTKTGYIFSGWTGSNGNNLQTSVTIQKGTTGNLTFNANYSANQNTPYKVVHKYEKLGGGYDEETQNLSGATGSKVTPQVISRTGFNSPEEVEITIGALGNTTLEYVYTRINYLVTLNNSEFINTTAITGNYPYGTQLTLQAVDREGYNFTGWSNGNNNQEITLTVTNAITIEPLYEIIKHTVTFNANEGLVGETSRKVNYNQPVGELPTATKVGQRFTGWYNGNTLVDETFVPTQDITLTAHWEESNSLISYTDSDNSGTINLGDYVKLGEDGFYVIGTENGKVKLLAEYNLDDDGRQSELWREVFFSDSIYWTNDVGEFYQEYDFDEDGYPYIYRNINNECTENNLYPYINNYKEYLINDVGIDIEDARLMSYKEALSTGCEFYMDNTCPEYIGNQLYWLGSASDSTNVWCLDSGGCLNACPYDGTDYISRGVRPVIIISESSISTP